MENNITNPTDPAYQSKVYKALKDNLEGFNKTEQEFKTALKDKNYQKNVYKALKDNLDGFDKDENEFYSLVADVSKPTPQKKNPNQSGVSNLDNGSSVFPKIKYGIDAAIEEASNPVSKRPQVAQNSKNNSFAEQIKQPDIFKNEYKDVDGTIKTYKQTPALTKGQEAIILAKKAKAKNDINLSQERLQQEKEQSGILNTLSQAGKAILNVTGEALSVVNESLGGTEGYFTIDEYKPLQDQKKKYIEKAKRENLPLTPEAIQKGAEEIFIEEDQLQQFQKNLDAELPENYDREGIWKELKLDNLKKNDALRQAVITADVYQKQLTEFDNFKKSIENIPQSQLTKTQIDTYNDLLNDAKESQKGIEYLQESFPKLLKEVKTSDELVDVFKYNYNDYERALSNIKNFAKGVVGGTVKYAAEGLSYIDEKTDEPGKAPTSADKALKSGLQIAKEIGNELLDEASSEREQFISYKAKDISNLGDFGSYMADLGTNQLPIYLTLAIAPELGSVLLGTMSAGDQFRNMEKEEMQPFSKKTTIGQKLLTSTIYGAAELGFERLGTVNVIKNIEATIASASNASRRLMKQNVLSSIKKGAQQFGFNSLLEGTTEYLTAEAQIGADKYVAGKEVSKQQANENRFESFIGGAAMGGGMSLIGGLWGQIASNARLYSDNQDIQKTKDILSKIDGLSEELKNNPNLTVDDKKIIYKKMDDLANQSFDIVTRNAEKGKTFSKEENSFLVAVNLMQDGLKTEFEKLKNSNLSTEQKKSLTEELNASFNQLEKNRNKTLKGEFSSIPDSEKVFKREIPQEDNLIDDGSVSDEQTPNNPFTDLTPQEQTKLKNQAARELIKEKNPDGKEGNFTVTDEEITQRAIENFNKANETKPPTPEAQPQAEAEKVAEVSPEVADVEEEIRKLQDIRDNGQPLKPLMFEEDYSQEELDAAEKKHKEDVKKHKEDLDQQISQKQTELEALQQKQSPVEGTATPQEISDLDFLDEVVPDDVLNNSQINNPSNNEGSGQVSASIPNSNQIKNDDAPKEPTLNPITDQEFLDFVENDFLSNERLNDIATKVRENKDLTPYEKRIAKEKEKEIFDINKKVEEVAAETKRKAEVDALSKIPAMERDEFLEYSNTEKPTEQRLNSIAYKNANNIELNNFEKRVYQDNKKVIDKVNKEKNLKENLLDKIPAEQKFTTKEGKYTVAKNGTDLELYDNNGQPVAVSPKTKQKYFLEALENGFMKRTEELPYPEGITGTEIERFELENETDPSVILQKLQDTEINLDGSTASDFKDFAIASYINKVTQSTFVRFGDRNNITRGIALTYFSKEGTPIDTLAQEISESMGIEVTPQDIVDFIVANPNGKRNILTVKNPAYLNLIDKFVELTGFRPTPSQIMDFKAKEVPPTRIDLEYANEVEVNDETLELIDLEKAAEDFDKWFVNLTPQEQVEFYFGLEEDYPNAYYQQRYNEQQEYEQSEKITSTAAPNSKGESKPDGSVGQNPQQAGSGKGNNNVPERKSGKIQGEEPTGNANAGNQRLEESILSTPNVFVRSTTINTKDAYLGKPGEGVFGEVKVGDKNFSAYKIPKGFKIKDLSDMVFDDYMSSNTFNLLEQEGYDAAYVMEIDGSTVLHVFDVSKLELFDKSLPELRVEQPETPKAEPKQSKRKIRDEKVDKKLDDAFKNLRDELNKLMSGVNPELAIKAAKIIAIYTEAGIYKLSDIVEDAYAKFGEISKEMFDALKQGYASFRETASDEVYSNLDSNTRNYTYEYFTNRLTNQEIQTTPKQEFIAEVQNRLINKEKLNIVSIRKIAESFGLTDIKDTTLQEYVEMAIINEAKNIANTNLLTTREKYGKIIELYETQPTISMRSSERIEKQQYSTPIPMSFLAGQFVRDIAPKTILEPSAGNGMMIFNVESKNVIANEIDKVRLENLKEQGFRQVTNQDGTLPFNVMVDGIVTNPPFGPAPKKDYLGYGVAGLDEQMVINALESMNDNGRASIVIGGHTNYNDNGTLKSQRAFLNYLYNYYNVTDIINIGGNLYQKQGTSFPTRMILIDGRKKPLKHNSENKIEFAPLKTDDNSKVVTNFEELYERIETSKNKQNENILPPSTPIIDNSGEKETAPETNIGNGNRANPDQLNIPGDRAKPQPNGDRKRPNGRKNGNSQQSTGLDLFSDGDTGGANTNLGIEEQQSQSEGIAIESENGRADDSTGAIPDEFTIELSNKPNELDGNKVEVDINSEKTPYPKQSKSAEIGSVVPTNMAQALSNILSQFGDIDAYVQSKLGYKTKEELFNALSAEQVDSVALAIYQMEKGKGLIIGDMTGVGKGRQAAAIIRYARLSGKRPVFFTEKPHLFSDLYRDLRDIGSSQLKPLIINQKSSDSDPSIIDENGNKIYSPLSAQQIKGILSGGKVPAGYDYVLITYSQLNGNPSKGLSPKQQFFANIAQDNIVVFDESHNAGGADSNTGVMIREILPLTSGVTYLSGTFAKKPENMPLYALKTSMKDANMSQEELISAIQQGGVPLQEIMSKNLVEMGEMIRRERDFTGVTIDWETLEQSKEELETIFDENIEIFNELIQFQREHINPIIEGLDEELADIQGSADSKKGTKDFGISNTPFASKTFNLVRQLLFSLKAEDVARETIKELKADRKPVIAVGNTMETFIKDIGEGNTISNYNYSLTLRKGLDGLFRYTEKDFNGDAEQKTLSINDLSEEGKQKYYELVDRINKVSANITISPIDIIKTRIKQAGFSVGELTGRSSELQINDDGTATVIKRQDKDKKKLARDFNNGEIDVLILNQSASTGISLHASKTFKDQRQRVMLSAQTQLDVNTEVQMRGRIDRTGQVLRGAYRYLISPIPAEQRLIMMFKAKLKSLDANTTSSQKSKTNDIEIVDFLNKYGDEIVVDYLKENREINDKLLDPLKFGELADEKIDEIKSSDGDASKVSGRVALLSVKEQADFYNEVAERYVAYINYLNSNNSNDLEITTLPLNAETKSSVVVVQGNNNGSPFSEDSVRETAEVDVLKKPLKSTEISQEIEKVLDGKTNLEYKNSNREKLTNYIEQLNTKEEKTIRENADKKYSAYKLKVEKEADRQKMSLAEKSLFVAEKLQDYSRITDFKVNEAKRRNENKKNAIGSMFSSFNVGTTYLIPSTADVSLNTIYSQGIFIGYKMKETLNPSNITAVFATLDSRRKVEIPLSKIEYLNTIVAQTSRSDSRTLDANLENWDSKRPTGTRRTAYIVTGNILQAYSVNKQGQLVSYTTKEGQIKQGILLPENYKPEDQKMRVQIIKVIDKIREGVPMVDASGDISISKQNSGYQLNVPLSKVRGGKYFLDDKLRDMIVGRDFKQLGQGMVGVVTENRLEDVLGYLSSVHNTSVETDTKPVQKKNNIVNEPIEAYGKNTTLALNKTQDGQEFLSLSEPGSEYSNSSQLNLWGQGDTVSNNDNRRSVRAVWTKYKNLQFKGTTKVKNAEDVAQIMSLLENKANEHAFAIHIDKEGNSHIQFLSIGGTTGTVVDPRIVAAGVSKFNSVKVYLVHNHPSGTMQPSDADMKITKQLREGLNPLGIVFEHIIMDTYLKEYVHIDNNNLFTVNKRGENTFKQRLIPIALTEQEILENHYGKVTDSKVAFSIIQNFRFSAFPKNAMLVLNNSGQVIGNYVFSNGDITYKEILAFIGDTATATSVIFYGNQANNLTDVKDFQRDLRKLDIVVLDKIVTSSDNNTVIGYYQSMIDEGMLNEHQEQYGTGSKKINQVNDPSQNKPLRLPQTIARQTIDQMRQDEKNKVSSDDLLKNAVEFIQRTDWYNNLDSNQQARVNNTTLKSLLQNAIKEINYLEDKIEEYKQQLKDNKLTAKQVFDDIIAFLKTNQIKGKITPTEINRLIKSAADITTKKDTTKALDDFMKLYEVIKEKALLRSDKNAREKAEVEYVVPIVESLVASGYDLQMVLDYFETDSQKRMAEIQYYKEKSKYATEEERVNKVDEAIAKQKQDLFNATYTSFREGLKKARLYWFNLISDRSYVPANLISKTGMQQTYYQFKNTKGYGHSAKEMYEKAHDKIWKGLTQDKIELLHDFIQMMRIITIDNNRGQNGLGPVQHPNNLSSIDAQSWLDEKKAELGDNEFNNIEKRTKEYFKAYQAVLDLKLENGFISQETYDALNGLDYQPRMFLHHAVNFDGDLSFEQKQHIISRSGLSKEQIKSLEDGSANSLILDAQWLLSNSISTLYQDIADNNLNRLFIAEEFPIAKEKYDELLTVPADQLTKEERRFIEYFKELSDKVIPNEIIGFNANTNDPIYKNDTPKNFVNKYYWADGVKHQFFMEENLAQQFDGAKGLFLNENSKEVVGNITGARLVKYFATGNNPLFVIVNTPRDFMWNIQVSEHYSGFVPLAMAQMTYQLFPSTYDFILTKLGRENTDMNLYLQHGGSMDYLHKQGDIAKKSFADRFIVKPITSIAGKNNQPVLEDKLRNNWISKGVGALNEWSELAFRIATFRRSINAQLKELGFENESQITDLVDENGVVTQTQKEILDNIYRKATYDARSILDFSQGGRLVKDLEEFVPYVNVGVQATRSYADAMKKRPISTTLKTLQIAVGGAAGFITLAMFMLAGDDDEPEEEKGKTVERKYIEFMQGISEETRSKYYIIPTKNRDEQGNRISYKIAKDQMLIPYNNFVETLIENKIRTKAGFKEIEAKQISKRMFKDVLEYNLSAKSLKDVPLFKAGTAWYAGYDLYRNKPLDKYAKSEALEGMSNPNVEGFYKYLGSEFKTSPIRTKYAIESMITSPQSNPYLATGYEVMDYAFTDKSMESLGSGVKEMLLKGLKNRTTTKSTDWTRSENLLNETNAQQFDAMLKEEAIRTLFKDKAKETSSENISETVSALKEQYKNDPNLGSYLQSFKSEYKKQKLMKESDVITQKLKQIASPGARAIAIIDIYGDVIDPENKDTYEMLVKNKVINAATLKYLQENNKKTAN